MISVILQHESHLNMAENQQNVTQGDKITEKDVGHKMINATRLKQVYLWE